MTQGSRAWHSAWLEMSTDLEKAGKKAGFEGKMIRLVFNNLPKFEEPKITCHCVLGKF